MFQMEEAFFKNYRRSETAKTNIGIELSKQHKPKWRKWTNKRRIVCFICDEQKHESRCELYEQKTNNKILTFEQKLLMLHLLSIVENEIVAEKWSDTKIVYFAVAVSIVINENVCAKRKWRLNKFIFLHNESYRRWPLATMHMLTPDSSLIFPINKLHTEMRSHDRRTRILFIFYFIYCLSVILVLLSIFHCDSVDVPTAAHSLCKQ